MGKMSRNKGKRGEREIAAKLRDAGYSARRSQQFCGVNGDADVVGLPGIHIEVKRTERAMLYDWMAQAKADAREGERPVIFHRRNDHKWLAIMDMDDWIEIYNAYEQEINDEDQALQS